MRNSIWTKNIILGLVIIAIPLLLVKFSFAQEGSDDPILISKLSINTPDDSVIEQFMETNDFAFERTDDSEDDQTEFIYANSEAPELKTRTIRKEDILRAVPSISTEDNKTLGLIIPPFAYFAKKF